LEPESISQRQLSVLSYTLKSLWKNIFKVCWKQMDQLELHC